MEPADIITTAGSAMAVLGVFSLRVSWSKPGRSRSLNTAAWSLILSGLFMGALGHGAWGLAVTVLSGMASASLLLSHSAMCAPAGKARAMNRRARILPEESAHLRIGQRLATFLLAIPGALFAALTFSLGARAVASWCGWSEADANAFALLAMPIAWSVLMVFLLMTENRRSHVLLLALPTGAGAILIALGTISA